MSKDYITIDPVLDTFDKEADGITKIHDKSMGIPIQELSGLGCGCNTGCTACGSTPQRAPQQGTIAPNTAQINSMELKMLRPIYDQLVQSRQQIIKNPNAVRALYQPEQMVKTIDYALANWSDKRKREKALDVLAAQDDKIMSDYLPKTVTAMQGLLGLTDHETLDMMGLSYYDDGLGGVALGGFWSGVKKAAKSVGNFTKKTVTTAGKAVKQSAKFVGTKAVVAAKKVGQAAKWTGQKVAQGAKFVAKQVMKYNPLSIAARNAYLFLVRMNFRGWATGLKNAIERGGEGKIKDKWTSTLISGDYPTLKRNIISGATRKRLLGLEGSGLGEPVTVGTALAAASGIIAAIVPIIDMFKKKGDNVETSAEQPTDPSQANLTENEAAQTNNQQSALPAPQSGGSSGLLIAGVAVAAIALMASGKSKDKTLSGVETPLKKVHVQL